MFPGKSRRNYELSVLLEKEATWTTRVEAKIIKIFSALTPWEGIDEELTHFNWRSWVYSYIDVYD